MISVGILYDAQKLMRVVHGVEVTTTQLLESFKRLEVADLPMVLSLAQECHWIELRETDLVGLTAQGQEIHDLRDGAIQLRHQLRDVLSILVLLGRRKLRMGDPKL